MSARAGHRHPELNRLADESGDERRSGRTSRTAGPCGACGRGSRHGGTHPRSPGRACGRRRASGLPRPRRAARGSRDHRHVAALARRRHRADDRLGSAAKLRGSVRVPPVWSRHAAELGSTRDGGGGVDGLVRRTPGLRVAAGGRAGRVADARAGDASSSRRPAREFSELTHEGTRHPARRRRRRGPDRPRGDPELRHQHVRVGQRHARGGDPAGRGRIVSTRPARPDRGARWGSFRCSRRSRICGTARKTLTATLDVPLYRALVANRGTARK